MAEIDGGGKGPMPTRFCGSCGTRLGDPAGRFCPSCGAEVGSAAGATTAAGPVTPNTGKRSRSWLIALIVLAVAAAAGGVVLLAGGGDSSKDSAGESGAEALPSPNELPPQTVALVSHTPSAVGTITRAELDHAIAQNAVQADLDTSPTPGSPEYDKTAEAALSEQLDSAWILGEATEMGLEVTPGEISEELAKLKRESFKSDGQYRRFLTESHITEADVDERVKVQILSAKVQEKVKQTSDENSRGQQRQQAEQEDFADFVTRYTARWRSRTVCAPRYVVEDCSNGPAPDRTPRSEGGETDNPVAP